MSKELTPLKTFELLCRSYVDDLNTLRHKDIEKDYFYNEKYGVTITDIKTGKSGKTADIEKALKALEIIKEKRVDVLQLLIAIKVNDLNEYNKRHAEYLQLTQEEFDLLKEYLK